MRRSIKKEEMLDQAYHCMRENMPYGLIQDVDGKVVIFNRNYKALSFGGKTEFDFDPMALGIEYEHVYNEKFLILEDGNVYVGKFFYLYEDADAPIYRLESKRTIQYFSRAYALLNQVIGKVENADANSSVTDEQRSIYKKKFRKLDELINNQ